MTAIDRIPNARPQVQRAAAGALRTLAFKNEENKNLIVECSALPTLIQMLRSDDAGIHYEAVGVIGNLVHSSQHIKKKVLDVSLLLCLGSAHDVICYIHFVFLGGSLLRVLHFLALVHCPICEPASSL